MRMISESAKKAKKRKAPEEQPVPSERVSFLSPNDDVSLDDLLPSLNSDFDALSEHTTFDQERRTLNILSNLYVEGHVTVNGSVRQAHADRSEWIPRVYENENIQPGMVIGWHFGSEIGTGISLSTDGAQYIGVVSTNPGLVGNLPHPEREIHGNPVTFGKGQCPVRTSGPVKAGQALFVSGMNDGTVVAAKDGHPPETGVQRVFNKYNIYCREYLTAVHYSSDGIQTLKARACFVLRDEVVGIGADSKVIDGIEEVDALVDLVEGSARRPEDERLCVDVQAVALLRSLPKKVTLVGVAGVARSGKSSLINLLLPEDTPSEELFCTGDSSESCTAGMWMSARPVTIGNHQVLLIDSEGLATGNTTHHPGMLCVLSMICTVLMINEMRQINVTSLTNLETLTAARDMMRDLIENLVKDLNGAGVVDIPSLTQVVHEKRCQKECQVQFKTYETAMYATQESYESANTDQCRVLESGTQIPAVGLLSSLPEKAIDWTKIDETHQRESELALDRYDQAIHSLKPDAREKFRKDLQTDMQHLLDGVKESVRQIHKARIQAAKQACENLKRLAPVFRTLFLPMNLPKTAKHQKEERAVATFMRRFLNEHAESGGAFGEMHQCGRQFCELHAGVLDTSSIHASLCHVSPDKHWAMYLHAQNAVVLIQREAGGGARAVLSAWQVQATAEDVMGNIGSPCQQLPHALTTVEWAKLVRMSFAELLLDLASTSRGLGAQTAVDWLLTALGGDSFTPLQGHEAHFHTVSKKMRDEVRCGSEDDSSYPWRRNPIWQALKGVMHLVCVHTSTAADCKNRDREYKMMRAHALAEALGQTAGSLQASRGGGAGAICDSDLLEGSRKLKRAHEKLLQRYDLEDLEPSDRQPFESAVTIALQRTGCHLQAKWKRLTDAEVSAEIALQEANIEHDCRQTLLASEHTLEAMLCQEIDLPPTTRVPDPTGYPRARCGAGMSTAAGVRVHLQCLRAAKKSAAKKMSHQVLDAIYDIERAAAALWPTGHLPQVGIQRSSPGLETGDASGGDAHAELLLTLLTELTAVGKEAFERDAIGLSSSRIFLVALALVLYIDRLAHTRYPLLREHRVGVPLRVLEPLFLATREHKELLHTLEEYMADRERAAHPATAAPSMAFGLRYSKQCSFMQTVLHDIDDKCKKLQKAKAKEVKAAREAHARLLQQYNEMTCTCHLSGCGMQLSECKCCELKRRMGNLKVCVYEKLLPDERDAQQKVVYELNQPKMLSCQRDAVVLFAELCGGGTTEQSKLVGFWEEEERVRAWNTCSRDVAAVRLGSTTQLSIAPRHVNEFHRLGSFIVSNGFNTILMQDANRLKAPSDWHWDATGRCRMSDFQSRSPFAGMIGWVNGWKHSENDVIARKSAAHESLALPEFLAFGQLRAGCRLQLPRLVQALVQGSLCFEREEVTKLIMAVLWQAGPGGQLASPKDRGPKIRADCTDAQPLSARDWPRPAFELFRQDGFLEEICKHAGNLLSACCASWSNQHTLLNVVLIAKAALEHCSARSKQSPAKLLHRARDVACQWLGDILELSGNVTDDAHLQALQSAMADIAVTGALTFGADVEHLLSTAEDCQAWLYFLATMRSNLPSDALWSSASDVFRRGLLLHVEYIGQLVAPAVHAQHAAGLNLFVAAFWSAARSSQGCTTRHWERYKAPADNWYWAEFVGEPVGDGPGPVALLQMDVVRGTFLVDGLPPQRLPEDIMRHPMYRRLFGGAILVVQPEFNGSLRTAQEINGAYFVFKRGSPHPVIVERRGASVAQLVPHTAFHSKDHDADFPHSFIDGYSHWLVQDGQGSAGDGAASPCVFFRPVKYDDPNFIKGYVGDNPGHEHVLHLAQGRRILHGARETYRHLVDIRSRTFKTLYDSVFCRLTPAAYLHITRDDVTTAVSVRLPRLQNIRFTLRQGPAGARLHSVEYTGMQIAPKQSFGALVGLQHGLLLERADTKHPAQVLLVPHGKVTRVDGQTYIDIKVLRQPALFKYTLREDLRDLRGPRERLACIFLARLHQLTSGLLPDPFTGRTGGAQAMSILRSGQCCGNVLTSIEGRPAMLKLEADTLMEIARESPSRKAHCTRRTTGKCAVEANSIPASSLEALSMLSGYAYMARLRLLDMADALACVGMQGADYLASNVLKDLEPRMAFLSARAYVSHREVYPRDMLLEPEEEERIFSKDHPTALGEQCVPYEPSGGLSQEDACILRGVARCAQSGVGMIWSVHARTAAPGLLQTLLCTRSSSTLRGCDRALEQAYVSGRAMAWAADLGDKFHDMWLILYEIARSRIRSANDRQAFGFLLTWLVQQDVSMHPHVHNLILVSSSWEQFQSLNPPPYSAYQRPGEKEYNELLVRAQIAMHVADFTEPAPSKVNKEHRKLLYDKELKLWNGRRGAHAQAVSESTDALVRTIRQAWDSGDEVLFTSLCVIKVPSPFPLATDINKLFTRWRHAAELHAFVEAVTHKLDEVRGDNTAAAIERDDASVQPLSSACLREFRGARPAFYLERCAVAADTAMPTQPTCGRPTVIEEATRILKAGRVDDVAADRTEFGHPDLNLLLTQVHYYRQGLSEEQLRQVFDVLKQRSSLSEAKAVYRQWVSGAPRSATEGLESYEAVNLKDDTLFRTKIYPAFRRHVCVINFWLFKTVYPSEAKQFPHTITYGTWELCPAQTQLVQAVTTGFSGTDDQQFVLPLTIRQRNLPELWHTGGAQLRCVAMPENDNYFALDGDNSAEELLERITAGDFLRKYPKLNVVLDPGALILQFSNAEFARRWLERRPDMQAAVFYDQSNVQRVLTREPGPATELGVSCYAEDLSRLKALPGEKELWRMLQSVDAVKRRLWEGILHACSSHRGLEDVGLWDAVTPYTVLLSLGRAGASALLIDDEGGLTDRRAVVFLAYAVALRDEQRLRRCLWLASQGPDHADRLAQELGNRGCEGWAPTEYPEFVLFEVDNDVCVRGMQATVARHMLEGTENRLLQLNMGEGKTAVIMPLVLAAAARGEHVVRATVLSSLFVTNAADWQRNLGGLLHRRVHPVWCRRDLPIDAAAAEKLLELCRAAPGDRHVLITVPESRGSLELKALELALESSQHFDLKASSALHQVGLFRRAVSRSAFSKLERRARLPVSRRCLRCRWGEDGIMCLIYLDDVHTRGSDFRLPVDTQAVLTLGKALPKDRLMQACLRMRLLGKGQSLVFCASREVHLSLQKLRASSSAESASSLADGPGGGAVGAPLMHLPGILSWAFSNTVTRICDLVPHFASQGRDHIQKRAAYEEHFLLGKDLQALARCCVRDEVLALEEMYAHPRELEKLPAIVRGVLRDALPLPLGQGLAEEIVAHVTRYMPHVTRYRSSADEEQERELEQEVEQQRSVERPLVATPCTPKVSPELEAFLRTGCVGNLAPFSEVLRGTSFCHVTRREFSSPKTFVTEDFMQTIAPTGATVDAHMKVPRWLLLAADHETFVIVSNHEAEACCEYLITHLAREGGQNQPRMCAFTPVVRLQQESISSMVPESPIEFPIALHVLGGSIHADHRVKEALLEYLGLYPRPSHDADEWDAMFECGFLERDGFICMQQIAETAVLDAAASMHSVQHTEALLRGRAANCPFKSKSPVSFLNRFWINARHLQDELSVSSLGRMAGI
eukprot:gene5609-6794_t